MTLQPHTRPRESLLRSMMVVASEIFEVDASRAISSQCWQIVGKGRVFFTVSCYRQRSSVSTQICSGSSLLPCIWEPLKPALHIPKVLMWRWRSGTLALGNHQVLSLNPPMFHLDPSSRSKPETSSPATSQGSQ